MVFTTTVVNAHALSHLFDGESSAIEHCKTCDEYISGNNNEDFSFTTPAHPELAFPKVEVTVKTLISVYFDNPPLIQKSGQFFNKPPPFRLV